MKLVRLVTGLLLSILYLAQPVTAVEPVSIDVNKPVSESLRPDGFLWAFDDGIVGTSEPKAVEDLSGNGIAGLLGASKEVPMPTYADGKFGTAIYLQGQGGIVRWAETFRTDSPMGFLTTDGTGKSFTTGMWFKMEDTKPVAHILLRRDGGNRKGFRVALVKADSKDNETPGSSWTMRIEHGDYKGNPGTLATTGAFADGGWHHIGVSVAPDTSSPQAEEELARFTAVYWLDGEVLDTVTFSTQEIVIEPGTHSIVVGDSAQGLVDDVFISSGVHTFKR
jgi:hypothetical protein